MDNFILKAIQKYENKNPVRFHMPGHKADNEFVKYFGHGGTDVTELSFLDNLANPKDFILKAEDNISHILKVKKSFIITDGATCGVLSALYAVKEYGKSIIISRNSHKSVFNACKLCNIDYYAVDCLTVRKNGELPFTDEIERILVNDKDCLGAFLTYPDYFGNTFDIEYVSNLIKKYNKLFLVDNSHGAYMRFDEGMKYAGDFADVCVDSFHKTLPTLTQGAVISVNKIELINSVFSALLLFRTSSPSYPIMASVEYGAEYAVENKDNILSLKKRILLLKDKLRNQGIEFLNNGDYLKLTVFFNEFCQSAKQVERELEKKNIFAEYIGEGKILFYFSVCTKQEEIDILEKAIFEIFSKKDKKIEKKDKKNIVYSINSSKNQNKESREKELVPLNESVGRILSENVGTFPPCTPIVLTNEVMTAEAVKILNDADSVFGVYNGCVYAFKDKI